LQKNVGGFEVAVQDAVLMGVVDGVGDGGDELGGLFRAESGERRAEGLGQTAALDPLHAEIATAVVFADLVDRHD
jgi:hypothetical protein